MERECICKLVKKQNEYDLVTDLAVRDRSGGVWGLTDI